MTEPIEFIYEPDPSVPVLPVPAYMYLRDLENDICYVGRLKADGSGFHFDGETVTLMPNLWEGDNA